MHTKNGIDINDLVIDIIAEIFEAGPDNKFYKINNFISSLRLPLEAIEPSGLFQAYYAFSTKLSAIQLARLYASYDPNGQRIQKNIREIILQNEKFEIHKCKFDTIYQVKNFICDGKLNYLLYDEFEKEFLMAASGRKSTRKLLEIIYDMLTRQNTNRKEIRLNDIVALFKSYYGYEEESFSRRDGEKDFPTTEDSFINKFEIEQICSKAIEKIKEKIFVDYFAKRKLNQEQAVGLVKAIEEIISDWIETGKSDLSYYSYLSKFIDLNKEVYELTFKAKLEYLIKEAKRQISLYLEE